MNHSPIFACAPVFVLAFSWLYDVPEHLPHVMLALGIVVTVVLIDWPVRIGALKMFLASFVLLCVWMWETLLWIVGAVWFAAVAVVKLKLFSYLEKHASPEVPGSNRFYCRMSATFSKDPCTCAESSMKVVIPNETRTVYTCTDLPIRAVSADPDGPIITSVSASDDKSAFRADDDSTIRADYVGCVITFGEQEQLILAISSDSQCCESWGFRFQHDDGSEIEAARAAERMIGRKLKSFELFDATTVDPNSGSDIDEQVHLLIETDDGNRHRFVVYNQHNGYYSHAVRFASSATGLVHLLV